MDQATWIDEAVRDMPALLTAAEAETALRLKRRKINQLVSDRRLTGVRHRESGSSRLLITRESVVRYLRSIADDSNHSAGAAA